MPLSGLATVELQLIMHLLDMPTLLRLARCSRWLLGAASHPFAWQHVPPLALQCGGEDPPPPSRAARLGASLLQGVRSALGVGAKKGDVMKLVLTPAQQLDRIQPSLLRFARAGVHWDLPPLPADGPIMRAQADSIAQLPLTSLLIFGSRAYGGEQPSGACDLLLAPAFRGGVACRSLSKLAQWVPWPPLSDVAALDMAALLPLCPRLTELKLELNCSEAGLTALFASLAQSRVHHFTLDYRPPGDACAAKVSTAVRSSNTLAYVHLTLTNVSDASIVSLAASLAESSGSMRWFRLRCKGFGAEAEAAMQEARRKRPNVFMSLGKFGW